MDSEDRQFLLTAAWLFLQHGQGSRARAVCEALVEANPKDGVSAAALAELLLADNEPDHALKVLAGARIPKHLDRVRAILETRACYAMGRRAEAEKRWNRYVASAKGAARTWVTK